MECYYKTKWVFVRIIFLCLGLIFEVVFYVRGAQPEMLKTIGWMAVFIFGIMVIRLAKELFRKGPIVRITPDGIEDLRGFGKIPWGDITSLKIMFSERLEQERIVSLKVQNVDKYLAFFVKHSSRLNWLFGYPRVYMSFYNLSPGLKEVWDFLKKQYPGKTEGAAQALGHS